MKTSLLKFTCLLAAPVLTVALCTGARAADKGTTPSKMDKTFVQKAGMGGIFEVDSGKLAADMGASQDVKDFGSKMVEDHGKANEELKSLASAKSLDIPSQLDATHQKMVDDLKSKTGKEFDAAYMADMTKAHKMDDALFVKEGKSGTDPDLKAFATKTDVVIKQHIAMLKDDKMKMK